MLPICHTLIPHGWQALIVKAFESPRGTERHPPLSATMRGQLSILSACWWRSRAFRRSWVWGLQLFHDFSPSPPAIHNASASLAAPHLTSASSSHHFSLLMIVRGLTRSSRMVHLVSHPSTTWERRPLPPVLTCVHLPQMHTREKTLASEPGGLGSQCQLSLQEWPRPSPSVNSKNPLLLELLGSFKATPMVHLWGHSRTNRYHLSSPSLVTKLFLQQQR